MANPYNIKGTMIYSGVIGSRAYGLETESSDVDVRGVYVPHLDDFLSLNSSPPEQYELTIPATEDVPHKKDVVIWELSKFMRQAAKGNPSILEVLWAGEYGWNCNAGYKLYNIRDAFLSKKVFNTYGGYATAQLRKFEASSATGTPDWKNAAHLCRLLYQGTCLLYTGKVEVRLEGKTLQDIRSIRNGEKTVEAVKAWAAWQEVMLNHARRITTLPDEPYWTTINRIYKEIQRDFL